MWSDLRVFIIILAFIRIAVLGLDYIQKANRKPPEPVVVDTTALERVLADLAIEPPPPHNLKCDQLFGEERLNVNLPNPQVLCTTSVPGYYTWRRIKYDGEFENLYRNPFPLIYSTGIFSTNPKRLYIAFEDMSGNVSEVEVEIISDFIPCDPPLCLRA
jgi:hypothetical protein